jgi:hypothetical protein
MRNAISIALACVFVCAMIAIATAAVPQLMNYQGVLRDSAGVAVADGIYQVAFRLYDTPGPGGTALWEETEAVAPKGGLFTVSLGSVTPIPQSAFVSDAYLAIQVGSDPEMTPRTRVASVGYAFQSANSDRVGGLSVPDLVPPALWDHAFREYVEGGGGETAVFTVSPGKTRYITGVFYSAEYDAAVRLDGSNILMVLGHGIAKDGTWQSGSGAPIVVKAGQTISVWSGTATRFTITGYEF